MMELLWCRRMGSLDGWLKRTVGTTTWVEFGAMRATMRNL